MSTDPLELARRRSRRTLWITLGVLFLSIMASMVYGWLRWKRWEAEWVRLGPIEATGGLFQQPRIELKVPLFRQSDERWQNELLGPGPATLGAEGCAVSSAAMVLAGYGFDTDPGRLNRFLQEHEGYTPNGWIHWEKAAEITNGQVEKAYEDLPSYQLIDLNLQAGNPVIVRLRKEGASTHFVVISGKDGYEYLTSDPGAGGAKGVYPLREYGSKIEALRFYRRISPPPQTTP